jgi:hypothetical protein
MVKGSLALLPKLFEVLLLEVLKIVERRCFYDLATRNVKQSKNK